MSNCKDGIESEEGDELIVLCNYDGETHVMTINSKTKLEDIFCSLRRKWEDVSQHGTELRYELQQENTTVRLVLDENIQQMLKVHILLKLKVH